MSTTETFSAKSKTNVVKKLSSSKWLDFEEPQVILYQGMRNSGKGVAVDATAEKLYNEGLLILHLWGARSFENLYWAINKNCGEHFDKMKSVLNYYFDRKIQPTKIPEHDKYQGILEDSKFIKFYMKGNQKVVEATEKGISLFQGNELHCKCSKAYPIVWLVPDYIEVDQESLDRFNDAYWHDFEEYKQYNSDITIEEKQLLLDGKLLKPEYLRPKALIKVRQFTTPSSANRTEIFKNEFTKIILDARKESRIVVMNPAIFEGQVDKFETLTAIIKMIQFLMNKSGHFTPLKESDVGKERKYWTKKQKSHHKIAIVINELRSVAPSSKLSGEAKAGLSKKAIFDFIPEARHFKTWFLGDYQNPQDLYDGVRHQANLVIIKRASRNILGDDWRWLFDKVEKDRLGFAKRFGGFAKQIENIGQLKFYESKSPRLKKYLDDRRPAPDNLPDNVGYVTYVNNEFRRETIGMPKFHHKQSTEDFINDTGIHWKTVENKKPTESKTLTKTEQKKSIQAKKQIKEDILKKIEVWRVKEQKGWDIIKEELVEQEAQGVIQDMGFSNKTTAYLSNWYGTWKKKQTE
ncbi:MAG: hypothetical protein ISR80_05915 [Nitrosopumilus sp.]|nr:hypothetical protein [Nitrosopumilus sp.]